MTAFPKPVKREKARKPLQRSKAMHKRSARRISRKSDEERLYLEWLHRQECCAKGIQFIRDGYTVTHWCYAGMYDRIGVEAAHLRDMTGMGRKESDLTAIPLCRELHDDLDNRAPHFFKGWPLQAKKDWHRLRQAEVLERWEASRK